MDEHHLRRCYCRRGRLRRYYCPRYRRRKFFGYEFKFETWGKINRRYVALPEDGLGADMYMQNNKRVEPFENLANRVKEAVYNAVELELSLESIYIVRKED